MEIEGADTSSIVTSEKDKPEYVTFPNKLATKLRGVGYDTCGFDITKPISTKDLQEKGYAMVNIVGYGTKSLVGNIEGQDVSRKLFLTEEEMDAARRQSVPEGIDERTLEELSEDMNKFKQEALARKSIYERIYPSDLPHAPADTRSLVREAYRKLVSERPKKGRWPFSRTTKAPYLEFEQESDLVITAIEDFSAQYTDKVSASAALRGVPISEIQYRDEGDFLDEGVCPVLDCGHIFHESHMGIKIRDRDGKISGEPGMEVRINDAVTHLAAHGIANTPHSEDGTQRYMTIKEFLPLFGRRNEQSNFPPELSDGNALLIQRGSFVVKRAFEKLGITVSDEDVTRVVDEYYNPVFYPHLQQQAA